MVKKDKIRNYDVISFDIFDTLICRCVEKPTDVFKIVENQYNKNHGLETTVDSFSSIRVISERKARQHTTKEEISFDEIYSFIQAEKNVLDEYKFIEKQVEIDVCIRNPEVFDIYEECIRQGKRVIITSDMYLPRETIEQILHKNGYKGYSKLYLSSEIGMTKASGSLYRYIIDEEKVKPGKILHLGDNIRSDVKNAIKAGIHTCYIKRKDNKKSTNFEAAILDNFIKYTNNNLDLYTMVGYSALGPMLYGFVDWIKTDAVEKGIEKLFFLSRDGFIMKQVYEMIKTDRDISAQYMYASRRALQVAAIHLNPDYTSVMASMFIPRTVTTEWLIKKWGLRVDECKSELATLGMDIDLTFNGKGIEDNLEVQALYEALKSKVVLNSQNEYKAFIEYLKSISFHGKIAIVDIGWYGNMQNALMKIIGSAGLKVDVTGYYLGIVPESNYQDKYQMNGYLFMKNKNEDLFWKFKYINSLMELFFMAPHGSAMRYYTDNNIPKVELADFEFESTDTYKLVKKVQKGAIEFVLTYHHSIARYVNNTVDVYLHNMLSTFISPKLVVAKAFGELAIWDERWIKIAPKAESFNISVLKQELRNVPWKMGYLKRLFIIPLKYDYLVFILRKKYTK